MVSPGQIFDYLYSMEIFDCLYCMVEVLIILITWGCSLRILFLSYTCIIMPIWPEQTFCILQLDSGLQSIATYCGSLSLIPLNFVAIPTNDALVNTQFWWKIHNAHWKAVQNHWPAASGTLCLSYCLATFWLVTELNAISDVIKSYPCETSLCEFRCTNVLWWQFYWPEITSKTKFKLHIKNKNTKE